MISLAAYFAEQKYADNPYVSGSIGRRLPALFRLSELHAVDGCQPLLRDVWFPHLQVMAARSQEGSENGFYMAPTLIENADPNEAISQEELFGPIACLYPVTDFNTAMALANNSSYGLTACIHTKSIHRAIEFTRKIQAGVAIVNAGTYGSEPHMPFGGLKNSGNGSREPGTEALDVYSELKGIYFNIDPAAV